MDGEFFRNRHSPDGFATWCKLCSRAANRAYYLSNKERVKAVARRWRDSNPGMFTHRVWVNKIRSKYGISEAEYMEMLSNQDNSCAVCKTLEPGGLGGSHFQVDHCHQTGRIRGLLCLGCNNGGKLTDNPDLLARKILYLIRSGSMLSSSILEDLVRNAA